MKSLHRHCSPITARSSIRALLPIIMLVACASVPSPAQAADETGIHATAPSSQQQSSDVGLQLRDLILERKKLLAEIESGNQQRTFLIAYSVVLTLALLGLLWSWLKQDDKKPVEFSTAAFTRTTTRTKAETVRRMNVKP